MNELRILGDLDLRGTDGNRVDSIVAQPKRLALLAYLTLATPGGAQQRDLLISVFWPELDESNARNSLNQSLHRLRLALGPETVASRGTNEVGIDPTKLSCDALDFVEAVDDGELERALKLYRGDLLKGLFVSDSPEFERWLDAERAMLRRKAFDAAITLGRGAEDVDDLASAARWHRRALSIMPERETAARRLMTVLARAGDAAGAVQVFDRFAAQLAADFGLQPSDEARAIVESIRRPLASEASLAPEAAEADRQALARELTDTLASQDVNGEAVGRRLSRRMVSFVAIAAVFLAVGAASYRWFIGSDEVIETDSLRVAVLPFENLSGNPEDDYFADGLHSELVGRLHGIGDLRVISRTSVLEYRGTTKNVKTIAEELDVEAVMETSVQRSGERIRINAQLIDGRTDEHLWANVYDRELTAENLFDVQGSIALDVARALGVDLSNGVEPVGIVEPTENLQAYEFYLRGKSYYGRFFEGSREAAVEMFQKATQLDSMFASAHAWLSFTTSNSYWYIFPRSEALAYQARRAAEKALELAPDLPETHLALGTYHYYVQLDYDRALEEYDVALGSWPNSPELFLMTASVKRRQGDYLAARDDFARAADLDRHFAIAAGELAQTDRFLRDYAISERHYLNVIAMNPDLTSAYEGLVELYIAWNGDTDRARAVLEEFAGGESDLESWLSRAWLDVERLDREYQAYLNRLDAVPDTVQWGTFFYPRSLLAADVLARMGQPEAAQAAYDSARVIIEPWLRENPDDARAHGALGIALAGLGRYTEAVREGRKAVELVPLSKDAFNAKEHLRELARIYAMVGEYDAAIDELELLLSLPGPLSVARLRIDPTWDPLRGQPRFQALVARGDE